ncbi:MAG: hypothetical protein ACFCU3_03260 [Verrucomicrobiales bacterium]
MTHPLRFRQIHLDFHTSGAIGGIGKRFNKQRYQETLRNAAVDSVTTFALCHHGWSYYDTQVGKRHPELEFDLLRAQFEACKEIDINVPIYLTAGVHNVAADEHPEWRVIGSDGRLAGWNNNNLEPGFKMLSFHSPYLDHLCDQIREVVRLFPEANGIFLDIISQPEDASIWGLQHMQIKGLDPLKAEDREQSRLDALKKYYERSTEAVRSIDPDMPVFHNSGHIRQGQRDILPYFSHLELESLPTGGWGYDHFPLSAKYVAKLGMEFLGMTGKFHSTWGEFGGYKHPNALRYECCAMLAYGAKCSVGDQLHPSGELDASTYRIIGEAYREVASKEAFVMGAVSLADVAFISNESISETPKQRTYPGDVGAARVLLEEHSLFDILDTEMDMASYKLLILPDSIRVGEALASTIKTYLAGGGKLLLTGESGLSAEGQLLFDVGGKTSGPSPFYPDYILPEAELQPEFCSDPMVMYCSSQRLEITDGQSLGVVYDPYFNRQWNHFCSHQHAPARPEPSGYHSGVIKGNLCYLAHPVFSAYSTHGQVALRQYLGKLLDRLLHGTKQVELENFPTTGRVSLTQQLTERRYILHLLNPTTINRGGATRLHGGNLAGTQQSYEVIEDIRPAFDIGIRLRLAEKIQSITLEPEGRKLEFSTSPDGITLRLDRLDLHQMVVCHY